MIRLPVGGSAPSPSRRPVPAFPEERGRATSRMEGAPREAPADAVLDLDAHDDLHGVGFSAPGMSCRRVCGRTLPKVLPRAKCRQYHDFRGCHRSIQNQGQPCPGRCPD